MLARINRLLSLRSTAVFVLGHSHIMALMAAAQERVTPIASKPAGLHVYFFDIWRHEPGYTFAEYPAREPTIKDGLGASVRAISAGYTDAIALTLLGGNVFNVIGMVQHPVPFDCVVPGFPEPVDVANHILSVSVIEDLMNPWLDLHQTELAAIAAGLPFPTCHAESPPVPADAEFCMNTLEQYFRDNTSGRGISPAPLRAKLRHIQSSVYRQTCKKSEATFIASPLQAQDREGYLRPEYYGHDGTHANARYGDLVIKQIEAMSGRELTWWGKFA